MSHAVTDHRTPDGRSPTSPRLMRNPVDFIAEDHLRLRTICAEMDRLAASLSPEPEALAGLLDYLAHELPALLADEDDDLMPRVVARAEPEDELPQLAERLEREHAEIDACLARVVTQLAAQDGAVPLPEALRCDLQRLAVVARRHLFLENAVLLPLARVRLTRQDLVELRGAMLRRRGLHDPFDAGDGREEGARK